MSTETRPDVDLEELLDSEFPCGGNHPANACGRTCSRSAVLMRRCHPGCSRPNSKYSYKCIGCWQAWYGEMSMVLVRKGSLSCADCLQSFRSVESFADYRPF